MSKPITGYAEGYYGRLLSWTERCQILDAMQRLGLNTYYYAPKEDPCHRLHWRTPYSAQWLQEFQVFCAQANERGIDVVAGVAPGLDFDFSHLPEGEDFRLLLIKSCALLQNGAQAISLLMDDIDEDFDKRCGEYELEGMAHAALANELAHALSLDHPTAQEYDHCLWVTPRIYADELISTAPDYLPSFLGTLQSRHHVLYCGSDVVAYALDESSLTALRAASARVDNAEHRIIFWDNLYANDYCPRRLFVGPWLRRHGVQDVLLNPTGMVHTDCLLLELMAKTMALSKSHDKEDLSSADMWKNILFAHDVPDMFMVLAPFFNHPVFNNGKAAHEEQLDSEALREAIEYCLWRWKTPLSREWYPAIFGLKHDLLTLAGQHLPLRIRKTQNAPLAEVLQRKLTP